MDKKSVYCSEIFLYFLMVLCKYLDTDLMCNGENREVGWS